MKERAKSNVLQRVSREDVLRDQFTLDELNDLNNYLAWNIWDVLVMRATEGESGMIPRQEYEILAFMNEFYRWPEILRMTTNEVGAEGVMKIGETARREIGTKVNSVHDWSIGAVGFGMGRCGLLALEAIKPQDYIAESNDILKFMQRVLWSTTFLSPALSLGQPPLWLQERLNLTALAIENRLYLDFKDCSLLHVHADPRLIDTPFEGIITVDPEGRLLHANRSAKCLLGLDQESALKTSTSLESLFGVRGQRIFDKLRMFPDETHSMPLINGHPLFARLRSPTERVHSLQRAAILSSSGRPPSCAFTHDLILEKAFKMASQAFAGEVPILMQGETGTGKEVFAKALHDNLAVTRPFVAINCSAIPSNLIEAELFGYSDGAFTGGRKGGAIGKIELANGGTLFLDEIGDMPLDMQTRLLRVLQERNLCRIGDTRVIPLDFRLLSASHRNLEALVAEHTFREDLFYRINGFCVTLPALRERSNLAALIDDLLQQLSPNLPKTLSPAALKALLDYSWPGNVRQLQQALKVACIFSGEQSLIDIENFPPDLQGKLLSNRDQKSGQSPLKRLEIDAIHKALAQNQGNISATASQLGLSRSTLYKKLRY